MAFSFGKPAVATGGGLFGNTQTQSGGTSLFGQPQQQQQNQPAQQTGGLFGQPAQQQQTSSLFGQPAQQNTGGGLFGGQQQGQQNNAFGQTQNQPQQQQTSLFGQTQQQNTGGGLFGQTQQQPQSSMFGQTAQQQQQLGQVGASQWQTPQSQPVTDQMKSIIEQWLPNSASCKFKYYFYNKVGVERVPFYGPNSALNEDPRSWDEALSKKPGPGYVPVLCTGFEQLGERIKAQQNTLSAYNRVMHEINNSLEAMMTKHETGTSVRILNAKRKHAVLKQRTLQLATKVQILRNKGYAMDKAEEALKSKLQELEKDVCDPQLPAKSEEIWARMVAVQARSKVLEREMAKVGGQQGSGLDEEAARKAEKVLEDYATQLAHLKKELVAIQQEFAEYQKEQSPQEAKKR